MALVRLTRKQPRIGYPLQGFPTLAAGDIQSRMNRFVDRLMNDPFPTLAAEPIGWNPPVDVVENSNELTLTAELAGVDQKDIDVSLDDGMLTLKGEKSEEREEGEEDSKFYLYERSYGSFQRSFALPSSVDPTKVTAEFEKGLLKVHMPKGERATPKGRKIEIRSA